MDRVHPQPSSGALERRQVSCCCDACGAPFKLALQDPKEDSYV